MIELYGRDLAGDRWRGAVDDIIRRDNLMFELSTSMNLSTSQSESANSSNLGAFGY
ncbi:hypothetical protein FIBSPDRAFT_950217 [Athelia psychrophila]|nr:hypothetical protein FIBSPDRAFT_950217 [Fibularhizoctonia sp. CBS 109695]